MAATGVQLNWANVTYASATIVRITSCMFSRGGELLEFAGDNNRYPVVVANNMNRPRCSITGGDVAALMSLIPGTVSTLTATQIDGLGSSGGAVTWTMTSAVHENSEDSGQFSQWATGTATFRAFSSDGSTNPLTFARS